MSVIFFLFLALLTGAQADGNKTPEASVCEKEQALEVLKKEIEVLHSLLEKRENAPIKNNNDALQKRFREALEKAKEELKNIDNAMKDYNKQLQTDKALTTPWQKFEQNVSLQIESFQDYMQELQKIYIESKEQDPTNFRPVTPGKEPRLARPVPRKRKRIKSELTQPLPSSSENENGSGPKIHYRDAEPSRSDEEPFLK
ncbi:hypothetical protein [Candidatus Finniella inopinata]|uniref:Uncharacterized protein n=1 Tax=Candidatus Finniella inopinata TaxID=1696036 RepID=A0A4Q7DGC8_9PROT|nr:hypothetical protein [Candidatus Finniella inopinata]RZI45911.1 hypothetical protein EQU50_05630 [Candidatus Finniella inopinata]